MSDRFDRRAAFQVASFKAAPAGKGEFEALVSVFGNVDLGGDRVVKGAFTKSLAAWQEKGDPIPFMWHHMWDDDTAILGAIDPANAAETNDGLVVKGQMFLDRERARNVWDLYSRRVLKEFSFGYNVKDAEKAKDGALDLLELDLHEVSAVFKGMNPATELLAVKALADVTATKDTGPRPAVKAGARHSKETIAALRRIRDEVDALISADAEDPPKSDEAEAQGKASDPDEDLKTQIRLLQET